MAGFYSKDFILESAFGQFTFSGIAVYIIATIGAIFTTLYSVKVLYLTFLTSPNGKYIGNYMTFDKFYSKNYYHFWDGYQIETYIHNLDFHEYDIGRSFEDYVNYYMVWPTNLSKYDCDYPIIARGGVWNIYNTLYPDKSSPREGDLFMTYLFSELGNSHICG